MIMQMHKKIIPKKSLLRARKCETKSRIEKPPAVAAHDLAKNGFKLFQKQRKKELQISRTRIAIFECSLFVHSFAEFNR